MLAGDLLWLRAPSQWHQAQVVKAIVYGYRIDVDHLETGGDASSVFLPADTSNIDQIKLRLQHHVMVIMVILTELCHYTAGAQYHENYCDQTLVIFPTPAFQYK